MKRPPRPSHPYLTQAERQQLDILVRRGARALRPEECNLLLSLAQRHFADLQHARGVAGGLRQEVNRLRGDLSAAEGELQERRDRDVRVRRLASDMRDWCSPHGIAIEYAHRLQAAIDGPGVIATHTANHPAAEARP